MPEINWQLLQPVDVGAQVQQGFATGMSMVKQIQSKNALRGYLANPDDPQAFNALAAFDPQGASALQGQRMDQQRSQVRAQEDQAAKAAEAEKRRTDNILKGASIIRELNPHDNDGWKQALAVAQNAGIDVSAVPQEYNAEYAQQMLATANALDPKKAEALPGIAKEVEWYNSIGRADLAQQLLANHAEGSPIAVDNGDGTKTLYPRALLGGAGRMAPPSIPPLPPGFKLDTDGGPTPPASGNFPG